MKCLLFDNYDSFTYNLRHMLLELGLEVDVRRNDRIALDEVAAYDRIVLSPGPGIPSEAGLLLPLIRRYAASKPILGICLGEQAIGEAFGARLENLAEVHHGVCSDIRVVADDPLFDGLETGFRAGRYHSWVVSAEGLPDCLEVTATDRSGLIMGLRHKTCNLRGIQFHPESVLTPQGKMILANWITKCNRTMKDLLYRLFEHQYMDRSEAQQVLAGIAAGKYNPEQVSALITVFLMRSISVEELAGFRDALLEMRRPADLSDYGPIDIVGTGGDGKNTFNISTAASFVVAGAGYNVVKHGNYGATSVSGASNVIERHGVRFTDDPDRLRASLDACRIAYLHAPLFNPAMKAVAPIRRNLAVRTFFNLLGPLVNPALPKYQLLGVYNLSLFRLYNYAYQSGGTRFGVVYSMDGYDEISLTSEFKVATPEKEQVFTPEQIGFGRCRPEELSGGDTPEEAARIFDSVLDNTATAARRDCVLANAAFAIRVICPEKEVAECLDEARESLLGGKAAAAFRKFVEINS